MKRIQNSKKGSSAVFLSIILAALIAIVMVLIYSVRENCIAGRMDAVSYTHLDVYKRQMQTFAFKRYEKM